MQHVILIYDIENDRVRGKVADACLDYGLDRIQYSAFSGKLRRTHQEELILRIRRLIKRTAASVQLIPIGEQEWKARLEVNRDGS